MPAELEPSPQLIVAVKSEAVPFGLASLKPNEALVGLTPSTPPLGVSVPAASGASTTFAVEVAVAVLLGVSTSVIVTVTAEVPSSA